MSLVLPDTKGKSFLINVFDTPGTVGLILSHFSLNNS